MITLDSLNKRDLMVATFQKAKEDKKKYIGILVHMENFPECEVIINRFENIDYKINYWCRVYDEKLQHKFSPDISIVEWAVGDSYAEIEQILE